MDLHQWGWSPELASAYLRLGQPTWTVGRVARHDRTGHLVATPVGDLFARTSARLRAEPPVVGDWVALDPREPPTLRALLPRRTLLARGAPGGAARPQPLAANVDLLLVVEDAAAPPNLARLQRFLVLAASAGAGALLVTNKADLADPRAPREAPPGVRRILASAATGLGLEELRAAVPPGTTAALVGPSGVGKSSLANALLGQDALPTAPVRERDRKGRHVTSARHLLPVAGGGVLLDAPGVRELALWDAEGAVADVFGDVEALARGCRFRDCAHDAEPGCAVRDVVPPARLEAWRKLRREAEATARRADVAKERAEARRWGRLARDAQRAKRERRA